MYLDTSRAMNSAAHEVFVVTRFTQVCFADN